VGASAVIFGLLAICLVWAPKNDLQCFVCFIIIFRIIANTFDIPILWFAAFHIGWESLELLLHAGLLGSPAVSALGHISGAGWGLGAGLLLLKLRWVDCGSWDIVAVVAVRV